MQLGAPRAQREAHLSPFEEQGTADRLSTGCALIAPRNERVFYGRVIGHNSLHDFESTGSLYSWPLFGTHQQQMFFFMANLLKSPCF